MRVPEDIREMWRLATPRGTQRLIEALDANRPIVVSGGKDAPAEIVHEPDWPVRLKAVEILYQRQYGAPTQPITGDEGGPFKVEGVDLTTLSDVQFAALVALRNSLKGG